MTLVIAALFGLLPAGMNACFAWVRGAKRHNVARVGLTAALALSAVIGPPRLEARQALGFRDAANFIHTRAGLAGHRMMVVSEEGGEGAFVAEIAARHPQPAATVFRASKIMGTDSWAGNQFEPRFTSSAALMQELEDLHVEYLVVDRSVDTTRHELWVPTDGILKEQASRLTQVYAPTGARPIVVYQLLHQSPGPAKTPQMMISSPLGQWPR
jgi:hypothetical protein